ncbi:MAG: NPCBM/NEW2 domain-containing protein [Armatimonadetes bacterium]|nr:NPCBM/NEW2 domain-containing protein [Armatimonadota bacterium]
MGNTTSRTASRFVVAVALLALLTVTGHTGETVPLTSLKLDLATQDWGTPRVDKSVDGNPLSIGGRKFEHGFGTHAMSVLYVSLKGGSDRFAAWVGVDDEIGDRGTVEFVVQGDERDLFRSGVMKGGQEAKKVDIDVRGIQILVLLVTDAGDGINYDHADWADAQFEVSGARPVAMAGPDGEPVILTPKPGPEPRINGPKVFGARPGNPFLFKVPATGDRPLTYAAEGLPEGLSIDPDTGIITGSVVQVGTYRAIITVSNALGSKSRELRIEIGEGIALTPPMGWNSWNCWAGAVDEDKVRRCARAMVSTGLVDHGWSYVNIDDTWQAARGGPLNALQGNEKFPDLKGLCDEIHSLGLKAGIYSTPWITSYAGFPGGSSNSEDGSWNRERGHGKFGFEEADAKQFAAWGFDYLKYDWNPNDVPHVEKMAVALRASGRDIVYSLSNSAPYELASEWMRLAHCWRTTGDITDRWSSVSGIGFSQDPWGPFAGPGHWNDPDMLVVGEVGWGPNLHPTHLTPNEQYSHISLWCLLSAPLLLGCDLEKLDDFTLSLLTNDEVLEINQDPLGEQARRVAVTGKTEVWCKYLEDGSRAVGLFNRGETEVTVTAHWPDLWIQGPQRVRDLWRQEDLDVFTDHFEAKVPRHGVVLVKLTADQ